MANLKATYLKKLQSKPSFPKYISIHWADYIELLCLANLDGEVSEYDLIDRFEERERDLTEGDQDDIETMKSLEDDSGEIAARRAEIDDNWKIQVEDWFKILRVRASTYAGAYPFVVNEKEIILKQKLNASQKIYIYLLLCANLYLLDKRTQLILANNFEILSYDALKSFLPANAEVHMFGSNPLNKTGKYKSSATFWDRFNELARDLSEHVNPKIKKSEYPTSNKGDGGLDLVAWIPAGDQLPSLLVLFAQCACTVDWINKQNDSSHQSWSNRISLTNNVNNIVFIPFCYRGADGQWFKVADIRQSFLVDRKRILHYLGDKYGDFEKSQASTIINEIITMKEGVV